MVASYNVNIVGTLKQSFLCHPHHESMWVSRGIDPHILNAGITKWVVSFISWSLYPRGNMPQCTRLPGTRGGLDVQEQRKISRYCHRLNHNSLVFQPVAWSLCWLSYHSSPLVKYQYFYLDYYVKLLVTSLWYKTTENNFITGIIQESWNYQQPATHYNLSTVIHGLMLNSLPQ